MFNLSSHSFCIDNDCPGRDSRPHGDLRIDSPPVNCDSLPPRLNRFEIRNKSSATQTQYQISSQPRPLPTGAARFAKNLRDRRHIAWFRYQHSHRRVHVSPQNTLMPFGGRYPIPILTPRQAHRKHRNRPKTINESCVPTQGSAWYPAANPNSSIVWQKSAACFELPTRDGFCRMRLLPEAHVIRAGCQIRTWKWT